MAASARALCPLRDENAARLAPTEELSSLVAINVEKRDQKKNSYRWKEGSRFYGVGYGREKRAWTAPAHDENRYVGPGREIHGWVPPCSIALLCLKGLFT